MFVAEKATASEFPKERLVLLEIKGRGSLGDPFGEHDGIRIFVKGAPKDARWVVAEITSIKGKLGSAECRGFFQSRDEAERKLKEMRGRKEISLKGENVVFVGQKPAMNYVLACVSLMNRGVEEIILKARGKAIIKAVDAVELLKRSFIQGLEIKGIHIGTEEVNRQEGKKRVSSIEITVKIARASQKK